MATFDTGWAQFNNLWDGRIQCVETKQDIANNKTTAKFSLQLRWTDISTTTHYDGKYSMTINGSTYSYTRSGDYSINVSNGTIVTVFSKEITITHNTDGSKSVPVSASLDMTSFGIYSISNKSITLTKIPRASSFTLNVSSATIGSTQITVNISRISSSFTHKVYYSCGSNHNWQANSGNEGSTTVSWTPSINDCNHYPNSTSGTATIKVDTYNGSTWIGTASKTLTLNVPSSVVPSISSVSVAENGGSGISGTFVKGKSKANVSISASGSYNSTISSYSTTITGLSTKSGSSFTSDTLNTPGTITFTTTVKDSRGRSASKSATITVYDYFAPGFTIKAKRCTDDGTIDEVNGTYFKITTAVTSYSDLNGANTLTWEVYSYTNYPGAEGWYLEQSGTGLKSSGYVIAGGGRATPDNSHEAKIVIKDKYGTYESKVDIQTAYITMDFLQGGKGIAFGKVASLNDTFECNMFGQFNRSLKTTRGTYCHQAGGTGGQNGYIKFGTIKVISEYANSPLVIKVGRRRDEVPKELLISFESIGGSTDPGLVNFYVRGTTGNFFIHKSESSTWDLYAKKNESWDNVGVFDLQMSKYLAEKIEISWHDGVQVSDLPSGYITAKEYNGFLIPSSGNWFNGGTPVVGTDGVMDIGKFLDFHFTNNGTTDYDSRIRIGDTGNVHFTGGVYPHETNKVRLGSSSYRWDELYLRLAPNVSSDRNMKENIEYIKSEKAKSKSVDEVITYEDMYNFVKDDLELATYNFINSEEQKMNFIAQDLLYNIDGTDNKVGQMIINPIAPPTEEEIAEAKANLEEDEVYTYPTLSYDMGMYISVLAGALKTALNKIDNLTEEIKNLKESK